MARERQDAPAKAEDARQALRMRYARGDTDPRRERRIDDAMDAAEAAANARWEERLARARMAEGVAREEFRAFVQAHFPQLGAELLPACVEANARFAEARAAYAAVLADKRALLKEVGGARRTRRHPAR